MATPNFYQLISKNARILSMIESADGEMTTAVEEMLRLTTDNAHETVAHMLELLDQNQDFIDASEKHLKEEQDRLARFKKMREVLEGHLQHGVETFGEFQIGSRKVMLSDSIATNITDASQLPTEYLRTVPAVAEKQLPDGVKILAALRKGVDIPGAERKINRKVVVK